MNANELRIGNLIYSELHSKNTDYTIVDIDFFGLSGYVKFWGIPLTEEWLLKFGFEVVYDSAFTKRLDFIKDERFDYLVNKHDETISGIRFKGNTFYKEVKHVHQLQNLYFAITGEELEFLDVAKHVEP